MRIGFIGLGSQGGGMALSLARADQHQVTLWARRASSVEPFAGTAAELAATPRELAARSELISICVFDESDVNEVLSGPDGVLAGAASGAIIAVHSTVSPAYVVESAARAADQGVHLIDAPVSGGGAKAEAGELLVMVGADEETFQRAKPGFQPYGGRVLRVGPVGSGQLSKLVNNNLMAAHIGLAEDALALGEALGLTRAGLTEVVTSGSGRSFALSILANLQGPDGAGETAAAVLSKDVGLLESTAAARGVDATALIGSAEHGLVALKHPRE